MFLQFEKLYIAAASSSSQTNATNPFHITWKPHFFSYFNRIYPFLVKNVALPNAEVIHLFWILLQLLSKRRSGSYALKKTKICGLKMMIFAINRRKLSLQQAMEADGC
jgi:hypothetical protein